MSTKLSTNVVVIGSGPGGYTAAFRAADLGLEVTLVEKYESLGGVCLNVGCIPSKALLHSAELINEAKHSKSIGIDFGTPEVNIDTLRNSKDKVVKKLTGGIKALAKARKVKVITASASFNDTHTLNLDNGDTLSFEHCIIAAGSAVAKPNIFPFDDPRVMDSTDALDLEHIPDRLLVVGGGIIGLEMATVYDALGSKITIVESLPQLINAVDEDIITPYFKRIKKQYENVYVNTQVSSMTANDSGIRVTFEGEHTLEDTFDKVLVAVGRAPNGKKIGCEHAGVVVNEYGFIPTNSQMQTNITHIYAIGDITSQPMLAHKAVHEAKVAAEVIAGHKSHFDALVIPSVAYTDPEIAWVGKTEKELITGETEYEKGVFPWAASGRSLSIGRSEGITKALFDKKTHRLIGISMVGTNAGELIAEGTLAIEMGADMSDIALTIHAHPTLSETVGFAAEMAEGTITDLLPPKK